MRFSIRDLLWTTVVVAMGFGWWVDHCQLEDRCEDYLVTKMRCESFEDRVSVLDAEVRNLRGMIMYNPVVSPSATRR